MTPAEGPPRVHLMCGLVCAGKTTLAKRQAAELPAMRFSRDEWMLRLFGLDTMTPGTWLRRRHARGWSGMSLSTPYTFGEA